MESKINKLLLSKSTFYPEKNEKLPEIGMMSLPAKYEKVNNWLFIVIFLPSLFLAVSTVKWQLHQDVLC